MSRQGICPVSPADRDELLAICRRTFQRPRPDGSLGRQFHGKTHACLAATLTIDPPDDPLLRHGLFARPGRYPALVRFSNSFFDDDAHPDVRGMAIKLAGIEGEVCAEAPPGQQDFVLMNEAIGPARDAAEAMHLFRALDGIRRISGATIMAPRYLFPSVLPWRARWRYFTFLGLSGLRHLLGRDLAQTTYNSVTPYRLGEGEAKFVVRPEPAAMARRPMRGRDFRARLQAALDAGPIGFEFCLQPRTLAGDPVDDARRAWRSPIRPVGRLEIPPQDVAATVAVGERLAFSPWNCLAAHQPLGSINELRRSAYAASAANRGAVAVPPVTAWTATPATRAGQTAKGAGDENFPVGSLLIAPALRPAVKAFYAVARAADDVADDPALTPDVKLQRLDQIDADLGRPDVPDVAVGHLRRLLRAFRRDAVRPRCANWDELMAYCADSANPVGRFLLDLHGESSAGHRASDALCAALQVLNHLQDCRTDYETLDRVYLPTDWLAAEGVADADLGAARATPALRRVLDRCLAGVAVLLAEARPLPLQLRSTRLALEAAAILALAEALARRLAVRDPLAVRVQLSKPAMVGHAALAVSGCLWLRTRQRLWRDRRQPA